MTSSAVKEIFLTLQGEGMQVGRPAVICRFAGCNLWSGREQDRHEAICRFCDTDFVSTDGTKGGRYRDARSLVEAIAAEWAGGEAHRLCVLTGGEPLLQVDEDLVQALHAQGFRIAAETNGTLAALEGIDWICVSPKSDGELAIRRGHELKLVYPQSAAPPERFEQMAFDNFLL
jgi:7-carboxy-7-deazaguanine synthase (Cx14CxxC type)